MTKTEIADANGVGRKATYVGGPVTVVTIDKDGPKWIEPGACK